MTDRASLPARNRGFLILVLALLLGGSALGLWWGTHRAGSGSEAGDDPALTSALRDAGIDGKQRAAIEELVRAYILDHPEILPQAMQALQQKQAAAAISPNRAAIETPFPGAVLGNPEGKVTLVEFTDFACPYCRASAKDVEALVAKNPDLRVVVRLLPIIGPMSEPSSRMGLAAAKQGRYAAFYKTMFDGPRPSPDSIAAAAQSSGLDLAAAKTFGASPDATLELQRNMSLAQRLQIDGTPAFVIGDQLVRGAVGEDALQSAVDAARKG
ncbi:MAG: DsbA family protein [Sphingomonadales bacterium]|nr:DsbA family protein [Sphingomonadales bacterium]MDE2569837.1 DsbA family protein [Sphingomonadales bacterium]